jgi:hypothetical protein
MLFRYEAPHSGAFSLLCKLYTVFLSLKFMQRLHLFWVILLLWIIASCREPSKTAKAFEDISGLFESGKYTFYVYEMDIDPELQKVFNRYWISVSENREWYIEYLKNNKHGDTIPYHEKFGITEEEYDQLTPQLNSTGFIVSDSFGVRVKKTKDNIVFDVKDGYTILNKIKIDCENEKIFVYDNEVFYQKEINTKNDAPIFWSGYEWMLESGKKEWIIYDKNANYYFIGLTIGRIINNKKTLLSVSMIHYEKGEPKLNFTLMGFFDKR